MTMTDTDLLLEARGLGRSHAGVWLLENINVRVQRGERLAVVGPSGAGKTLLLRALAMLDPLDTGTVCWMSQPVLPAAVPHFRSQAMYLHQKPALFDGSVLDNLQVPFQLKAHHGRAFDRDRAVNLLAELGREASFLDKRQRDLSGGEGQIVALVRDLQLAPTCCSSMSRPGHRSPHNARRPRRSSTAGTPRTKTYAVLWVSHDREQIERVSKHRIALRHGRLE